MAEEKEILTDDRSRPQLDAANELEKLTIENLGSQQFKELRESLGYTQSEFAAIIGVSRVAIARAEGKQGPSRLVLSLLDVSRLERRLVQKSAK